MWRKTCQLLKLLAACHRNDHGASNPKQPREIARTRPAKGAVRGPSSTLFEKLRRLPSPKTRINTEPIVVILANSALVFCGELTGLLSIVFTFVEEACDVSSGFVTAAGEAV